MALHPDGYSLASGSDIQEEFVNVYNLLEAKDILKKTSPAMAKEIILLELSRIDRSGIDGLIQYLLASDFFDAPASATHHLAIPGGLALHGLGVSLALEFLCGMTGGTFNPDSRKIVGLLHDVCKIAFYKQDDAGRYRIDDAEPLGHGEKSVIILQRYIRLTRAEMLAIRWHMGAWYAEGHMQRAALDQAMEESELLRLLMIADQWATFFLEER